MMGWKRREVITLLGGAAATWPIAARAQQRVHVVGVLASQLLPPLQRFERKLREYGYIEGQNVRLVPRFLRKVVMIATPRWRRNWLRFQSI